MRKRLYLITITLWLVGCGAGSTPDAPPLAEARATAASEADGGEAPRVLFQRAPEGAESLEEYRIYAGGRTAVIRAAPGGVEVSEAQVAVEALDLLVRNLEAAGFFEAGSAGEQRWTATIDYLLSVHRDDQGPGDQVHSLAIDEVSTQTSSQRLQSLSVMEQFIFEELGNE
jgi:hypothetical protein